MTIKRKAILISSPVSTGKDLGTDADVDLWQKFLTSSNGGCWTSKEIQPFFSPTAQTVIDYIRNLKVVYPKLDYVFLAYSGHGQNGTSGDVIFPFTNLTDILPISNIKDEIELLDVKATIIIDACRLSSNPSSTISNNQQRTNQSPPISNLNFRDSDAKPRLAYEWIASNIRMGSGVVLIQSCDKTEESRMVEYSDIKCSLFTSELIRIGLTASNSMSIQDAFSLAAGKTTTISTHIDPNRVQHPQISDRTVINAFCLGSNEIVQFESEERSKFQNS